MTNSAEKPAAARPVAMLTSQYPAPSHTFMRREVAALRDHGLVMDTYSVRPPPSPQALTGPDAEAHRTTFYLLPPRPLAFVAAHAAALTLRPLRYLSILALALRHRVPGLRGLVWGLFYFAEAIYLARELRRRGTRRVHNQFANAAAIVGLLVTRYLGLPWSLTLHGISEFDYPAGLLLADKIRAAETVACVSSFGRAQAMRLVEPEQWAKLFISRCGVELDRLPDRKPHGGSRVRVVCVARMGPEKGLEGLIQALAAAVAGGADLELRLLGDGPERARLEAAVAARGLGDRVQMPGAASEGRCLEEIAAADLLAMSSLMEGLPVVLMEALALGVPVVAPCVAGIPELVEDGVTGLLYTVGDWDGLARQMGVLAADPSLRERLAQAGQRRVAEDFDVSRATRELARRLA